MTNPAELKLGLYRHYKGGLYEVVGTATHSETLEKMVVYKHLDDGQIWVRPLSMFTELVEIDPSSRAKLTTGHGGKKIPRFLYTGK